jgi:hypothetical protein
MLISIIAYSKQLYSTYLLLNLWVLTANEDPVPLSHKLWNLQRNGCLFKLDPKYIIMKTQE